jgi:hypothetical protein
MYRKREVSQTRMFNSRSREASPTVMVQIQTLADAPEETHTEHTYTTHTKYTRITITEEESLKKTHVQQ